MEAQTRQLLRLLADDLTDALLTELAEGERLETELQRRTPSSRQTLTRRLEELETWGIIVSRTRSTPGRGRPTREWRLADIEVAHFGGAADRFLLNLMEQRADRHREAIARRTKGHAQRSSQAKRCR
jgi:predicted ArsR family transcriptional regulator